MAATIRTPAASIKISAISKPAITRAFDMGTLPTIVTLSFTSLPRSVSRGQIAWKSRNRAHSRKRNLTNSRNAAAKDMPARGICDAAERRVTSDWRLRLNCHGQRRDVRSALQCQRQSIAFIRAIDRNSLLCGAGRARGAHGSRECTNNKTDGYCYGNYTLESARRRCAIARPRKSFELPVHLRTPLRRMLGRSGQVLPLHVGQSR
jgi:hypothetical protein